VCGLVVALGAGVHGQDRSGPASADQWYRMGLRAMNEGQVETARECFTEVLRLRPGDMNARYQLRQLTLEMNSLLAKKRESQLAAITVPRVDFDQLNAREALGALGALVEKQTENKFAPNFVVQDPNGLLAERRFSLELTNVPATVVLKYILENARASARYDQHAIVVKPLPNTGS